MPTHIQKLYFITPLILEIYMEIHHFESTLGVILKASEHVCRLIIMFKLVASLDISAYKKKTFSPFGSFRRYWTFRNLVIWLSRAYPDVPGHICCFLGYLSKDIQNINLLHLFWSYCWFIILKYFGHAQSCRTNPKWFVASIDVFPLKMTSHF